MKNHKVDSGKSGIYNLLPPINMNQNNYITPRFPDSFSGMDKIILMNQNNNKSGINNSECSSSEESKESSKTEKSSSEFDIHKSVHTSKDYSSQNSKSVKEAEDQGQFLKGDEEVKIEINKDKNSIVRLFGVYLLCRMINNKQVFKNCLMLRITDFQEKNQSKIVLLKLVVQ